MTLDNVVFWLFVVAWIIVLALILGVAVPRIVGAARTLGKRVAKITDLPIVDRFDRAERDIARISAALDQFAPLEARGRRAMTELRTTRLVPSSITDAVRTIRAELGAFRREFR